MSGDKVKRVQAVRKWLEKAEHSYSSHKEITGEINLIMAQAEMQRLNETHKNSALRRWLLRAGAMGAAFTLFLGMNALWNMLNPSAEEPERPVQIVIHEKERAPEGGAEDMKVSAAGEDKSLSEAAAQPEQRAEPAPAPVYTPPAAVETKPAPSMAPAPAPKPAPPLSDREIQSVVGEAGRALRGQA